jgi:hypothetical protein
LFSTFWAQPQYQQVFSIVDAVGLLPPSSFPKAMNASRLSLFLVLLALATTLTSCEAIGDIFKAGAYTAIIGIFLVVALLWFIIRKVGGRR